MIESTFNEIILLLSRHFEVIMAFNIGLGIYYVLILIFLKLTDRSLRNYLKNALESMLHASFFIAQCMIIALMVYLYWFNYLKPAEYLAIPGDISLHTYWAKSHQEIFFIDGNDLLVTQANGEGRDYIFEGSEPLKEYHFSPNGKHMLILTGKRLVLLDRATKEWREIDGLGQSVGEDQRAVISGLRWARDSQKFCYEISRWSPVSSQDSIFIYSLADQTKRAVQSAARRISSLYWDEEGENLYYLKHETEDRASINQVKVVRIPLTTLIPEMVTEIPYDQTTLPLINLEMRGIRLFVKGDLLAFGGAAEKEQLVSTKGRQIGIDGEDNFYFINEKWFRQRLFKVRRRPVPQEGELKRHQYAGGELTISNIRWLPDGRYVVMQQFDLGVLILDPFKNKLGQLLEKRGHSYGWFIDIDRYHIPETYFENLPEEGENKTKRSLSFFPR
jgi:hypothetical protein